MSDGPILEVGKRHAGELAAKATTDGKRVDGEVSVSASGSNWLTRAWAKVTTERKQKPAFSAGVEASARWLISPTKEHNVMDFPNLSELPLDGAAIQKLIDDWFAGQTQLHAYVTAVRYVPQGAAVPEGMTQTLEVVSTRTSQKLVVALAVKQPYAALADLLLAIV